MRAWARRGQWPGLNALAPKQKPSAERTLLTLDLLMEHQGEVVHLQDVGEHAQCVSQVDLQEKLCPCWPSRTGPHRLDNRYNICHSRSDEFRVEKRPRRALEHSVL